MFIGKAFQTNVHGENEWVGDKLSSTSEPTVELMSVSLSPST